MGARKHFPRQVIEKKIERQLAGVKLNHTELQNGLGSPAGEKHCQRKSALVCGGGKGPACTTDVDAEVSQ